MPADPETQASIRQLRGGYIQTFPGYEFTSPAEKFGKTFWRFVVLPSRTGDGLVTDYEWLNTAWNGKGVWYPSNEWPRYDINDGMFAGLPKTAVRSLWEHYNHEFERLNGTARADPQLALDIGQPQRPAPAPISGATMRAIIVNAEDRTVSEAEIDGSLESLQKIVGGLIDAVYPGLEGTDHHCYVNDEGLLNSPQHFFMLRDGHQPLAGNGVILSTTDDGGEAPCTLSLDWVKERVTFMDLQAVRQWVARAPDQQVTASLVGEGEEREEARTETYSAWFYTDANYATEEIDAKTPKEALAKARAMNEQDEITDFEHYDHGAPVNHIVIRDAEGSDDLAQWQDEDLRLRLAAPAMLEALRYIDNHCRELWAQDEKYRPGISYILDAAETAIAGVTGPEPERPAERSPDAVRELPPDPEKMNNDRAEWAAAALRHFQCTTGTDYDDSLTDLLGDLMHWADRNGVDFTGELARAQRHYQAETDAELVCENEIAGDEHYPGLTRDAEKDEPERSR